MSRAHRAPTIQRFDTPLFLSFLFLFLFPSITTFASPRPAASPTTSTRRILSFSLSLSLSLSLTHSLSRYFRRFFNRHALRRRVRNLQRNEPMYHTVSLCPSPTRGPCVQFVSLRRDRTQCAVYVSPSLSLSLPLAPPPVMFCFANVRVISATDDRSRGTRLSTRTRQRFSHARRLAHL